METIGRLRSRASCLRPRQLDISGPCVEVMTCLANGFILAWAGASYEELKSATSPRNVGIKTQLEVLQRSSNEWTSLSKGSCFKHVKPACYPQTSSSCYEVSETSKAVSA